jgi:hypothetical protein
MSIKKNDMPANKKILLVISLLLAVLMVEVSDVDIGNNQFDLFDTVL